MNVAQGILLGLIIGIVIATIVEKWLHREDTRDLEHYRETFRRLYDFSQDDVKAPRGRHAGQPHRRERHLFAVQPLVFDPPIPDFLQDQDEASDDDGVVNIDELMRDWGGR